MTIRLGGVTLNDHISWRGRFNSPFAGSERPTLGGRLVTQRAPGNAPDIILEAIEEDNVRKGYFTQSQLEQIEVFKNSGQTITLEYHSETFQVVVKFDGINVEKTLWKSTYSSDERYIGYIGLKRVG